MLLSTLSSKGVAKSVLSFLSEEEQAKLNSTSSVLRSIIESQNIPRFVVSKRALEAFAELKEQTVNEFSNCYHLNSKNAFVLIAPIAMISLMLALRIALNAQQFDTAIIFSSSFYLIFVVCYFSENHPKYLSELQISQWPRSWKNKLEKIANEFEVSPHHFQDFLEYRNSFFKALNRSTSDKFAKLQKLIQAEIRMDIEEHKVPAEVGDMRSALVVKRI